MAEPVNRLVIVDDEPVILNLLASMFASDAEIEVVKCGDGASARAALQQGVDVLLTDKNLPDIGGLELAREARDLHPDVEIIIITGYASLDTALVAMGLDVFDYIVKPPSDIHEVRRKVLQALEKQSMGRENRRLVERLRVRNAELEATLEELRRVQSELIQSEKLAGIGTLAAGVAHEISSPLFGVMGLAEAILEEDDAELVRGYAREIVDYSAAIKDIVTQLSGYSRSARTEFVGEVDLEEVVSDAIKLVTRSSGLGAELVATDCPERVAVEARAGELQQVFVNLIRNALEALGEAPESTEERAPVRIRLRREGGVVRAVVEDDGPGISEDGLKAVFDPFYTTKPPGRGTGLGLNIVYRIVTRYRGRITAESSEGGGARFVLELPAAERGTGASGGAS